MDVIGFTKQSLFSIKAVAMDRRLFLSAGLGSLGFMLLPTALRAEAQEDPHFFLQIYIYGGLDSLFLFDGRFKNMTAAGIAHDHVKEEPKLWEGVNGGHCLATSIARRLEKYRKNFSVVNGVYMATSFDGHPQNVNFLFTGNPFGGESFVPHMNERTDTSYRKRPLDALQSGGFPLDHNNGGSTIPLSVESAVKLIETVKRSRTMDVHQPAIGFLRSRFRALSSGGGQFSRGSAAMGHGYAAAPDLSERLTRVRLTPQRSPEAGFMQMMSGFFKEGIASAAILQLVPDIEHFDVHSGIAARRQVLAYNSVMDKLVRVFDLLTTLPFDRTRSLMDVTTVLVASEFGRALRQPGLALDETGTDHNVLSNSMLIGGKGIRGGLVIGDSDWQSPTEELSPAHRIVDPNGLKFMGRPFDFTAGQSRTDKPETFDLDDYITMSSVVNTIYSCLSVPRTKWRTVKRDGPSAPLLSRLL